MKGVNAGRFETNGVNQERGEIRGGRGESLGWRRRARNDRI